jgi:hypothetical protein
MREKNDSSAEHGGMRKAKMPAKEHEKAQPKTACCGEKYASEFGNPADLTKSTNALASYMKKNKMKY